MVHHCKFLLKKISFELLKINSLFVSPWVLLTYRENFPWFKFTSSWDSVFFWESHSFTGFKNLPCHCLRFLWWSWVLVIKKTFTFILYFIQIYCPDFILLIDVTTQHYLFLSCKKFNMYIWDVPKSTWQKKIRPHIWWVFFGTRCVFP